MISFSLNTRSLDSSLFGRFIIRKGLTSNASRSSPHENIFLVYARTLFAITGAPRSLISSNTSTRSRRVASEDGNDDLIPDDAINQMNRYRDALIHLSAGDDGITEKSRPIVGAFVLYPGWFDEETGTNPYATAVESVGIGGFPLLPGRDNLWLKAFLKEKFGDLSCPESIERALDPDEHLLNESVRIAPTGLSLSRYDDLTLVASLGNVSKRNKSYRLHLKIVSARHT